MLKNGGTSSCPKKNSALSYVRLKTELHKGLQERALMDYSKIARRLRDKVTRFSGELCKGLGKTATRFVTESVYGILVSQSVVLTKMGRTLENDVPLKKIEERFCRQLAKPVCGITSNTPCYLRLQLLLSRILCWYLIPVIFKRSMPSRWSIWLMCEMVVMM